MERNEELESQLVHKDETLNEQKQIIEQLESKLMDQQLEINNHKSTTARLSKTECDLRAKIESYKSRFLKQEESLRRTNEQTYSLKSEIHNLQTDIINMVNVEDSLRQELETSLNRKQEMEEVLSQMKAKACSDAITLRHTVSENEHVKREIINLKENIKHLNTENMDLKKENELLKEKAFGLEKQNLYLRNSVDTKEDRVAEVTKELERTKSLLNTQRELSRNSEKFVKVDREATQEDYDKDESDHRFETFHEYSMQQESFSTKPNHSLSWSQVVNTSYNRRNKSSFQGFQDFGLGINQEMPSMGMSSHHTKSVKELPTQSNFNIQSQKPGANKLEFLNRQLQELWEKSKMLEADYCRLPIVVNKSTQWQKKKEYLEAELDQVTKDISSVKRKIKEYNRKSMDFQ